MIRTSTSGKSDLAFRYDAMGNRICKIVMPRDGAGITDQDTWTYTYYVRDASGNVIAVYDRDYSTPGATYTDEYSLKENHLYGSSRVGIRTIDEAQVATTYTYSSTNANGTFVGSFSSRSSTAASTTNFNHELKRKAYELNNHLGNVLVTVSDVRTANNSGGTIVSFNAVVISASDYYAFGSEMVGRSVSASSYRFNFNGQETLDELTEGSLDFGARVYESRLGRWMSMDPLYLKYPHLSPYNFVDNAPLNAMDGDGRDIIVLCAKIGADDPEGSHPTGHQAVLIGDDKTGWYFYSYDKDQKDDATGNDNYTNGRYFATLDEFAQSEYNTYKDDYDDKKGTETSHKDKDGKIIQRFTEGYRIQTTKVQDNKMKAAAAKTFEKGYSIILGNECTTVVENALEAAGLKKGTYGGDGNKTNTYGLPNSENSMPQAKQKQIEILNRGKDVDDLLKRDKGELKDGGKDAEPMVK